MILPGTEAYIKAGLAKSAFTSAIYGGMPLDFYLAGIELTYRLISVRPKFYQIHDLFLAFYQPVEVVVPALKQKNKAAPAWLAFMYGLTKHQKFIRLNKLTQGSTELAATAAALLLMRLGAVTLGQRQYTIDEVNQIMRQLEGGSVLSGLEAEAEAAGGPQRLYAALEKDMRSFGKGVAAVDLEDVAKKVMEYLQSKQEAEAAAAALAGGHGYSLEGLSVWSFLQNPDEFRRRVWILTSTVTAFRMFMKALPAALEREYVESPWGGVDGITKMMQYAQLKEALPSELALSHVSRTLFAAKVAQMSITVYRHAATVKPVIFVDKSGSMAETFSGGDVAKISMAAGLALALYRRYGATVYLFDTETEKVTPREVVETLLRIKADGGTNIAAVMEEAMRIDRPDHIYIIISDGITDASPELIHQFVSRCGARTRLILIPPSQDHYLWVQELKKRGNVVYARDVAQFEEAARRIFARML
jgi:uncharacterized protein with von Willebrand factor type A (vWA) domain